MKVKVTNSLNEPMFIAEVPNAFVEYTASINTMKPYIKEVVNGEAVYDGYFIEYTKFV